MSECNGDGFCLVGLQTGNNSYHISSCIHNCMPVKCPNFLVCGSISPQAIYNINNGICLNCRVSFNTRLNISNSEKCTLCDKNNIVVKRLYCHHKVCIKCFQRIHFDNKNNLSLVCNICSS